MIQKDHFLNEQQLEAMIGPRTREVMNVFLKEGPLTVPKLQGKLELESKTLYYQVAKLEKVGLLSRDLGDPATYTPIAWNLRMPAGYQGARYERLAAKNVAAGLRRMTRQFEQTAQAAPEQPTLVDDLYYLVGSLRLTAESRAAFQAELRDLFNRYSAGEGRPIVATFAHAPVVREKGS